MNDIDVNNWQYLNFDFNSKLWNNFYDIGQSLASKLAFKS